MYIKDLQEYIQSLSQYTGVSRESVTLLEETLACFVGVLGRRLDARVNPQADLLQLTIRLLLISDGLARSESSLQFDGIHYLVGMGFEQSGALLARFFAEKKISEHENPMANDHWYRLLLAQLHYLAGGYRVQALSALRQLERISQSITGDFNLYQSDFQALQSFYRGTSSQNPIGQLERWLLADSLPDDTQGKHINLLAGKIRQRRDIVLSNLGRGAESDWMVVHEVNSNAADFWTNYLNRLEGRGITTFTSQQAGNDNQFEWLKNNNDLLVILPTGSGKTVVGELRTALTLANNKQVVWLLPTRALVRQTALAMRRAFRSLQVTVEELPTTEDPIPLFSDDLTGQRHLAITTPERFSALVRANQEAIKQVGLIVFDEAQLLLEKGRGTTAEFVLHRVRQLMPSCNFVLMTAFSELEIPLERFLTKLKAQQPTKLVSDTRLIRRTYGVLTNYQPINESKQHPLVLLFPPGSQESVGMTEHPYALLCKESLPSAPGAVNIAQRFAKTLNQVGFRSVIFVYRVVSTETQALIIARGQKQEVNLPQKDVSRLQIELGRESVIEESGKKGIVPHHGRLTRLEQSIAEKWIQTDLVKTVVATPTLARGVNLPFDFSIVTYTSRQREPLAPREIMNMIGRAGRAGYVSDGIGLIVQTNAGSWKQGVDALDNSRRYFFHQVEPSQEYLGLSRLVVNCVRANIGTFNYPLELGVLNFSEIQALHSFILQIKNQGDDIEDTIREQMESYPSIQGLSDSEIQNAVFSFNAFNENLNDLFENSDPLLPIIMQRTGLPLEVLQIFLKEFRSVDLSLMAIRGEEGQVSWADQVVHKALASCSIRPWYERLFGDKFDLDKMFIVILSWRSGNPISHLERIWHSDQTEKETRLEVGGFINHKLSLLAQFWGALPVCYEEVFGVQQNDFAKMLHEIPVFTREGVSSTLQLNWLYALGKLDRVLAHEFARIWQLLGRPQESFGYIRGQLRRWYLEQEPWPPQLSEEYKIALMAVISELSY